MTSATTFVVHAAAHAIPLATVVPRPVGTDFTPYIIGVGMAAVFISLGLWASWGNRKLRREPPERQDERLRRKFAEHPWGHPQLSVDIDLNCYGLPCDRIKAIADECGYDFKQRVKNRNTNALRFTLRGAAR